jgi:SAM-dependent methyltransferase
MDPWIPSLEAHQMPLNLFQKEKEDIHHSSLTLVGDNLFRQGMALRSDLQTEEFRRIFAQLKGFNLRFLDCASINQTSARWSRNPLEHWSRVWEYPFCTNNVGNTPGARLLDAGSGLTFLPFYLNSKGVRVYCVDADRRIKRNFSICNRALGADVCLVGSTLDALPFQNAAFDEIVCISVLEHLEYPVAALEELIRVLRPGGRFVLTHDVSLGVGGRLTLSETRQIRDFLLERLDSDVAIDFDLGNDILTNEQQIKAQLGTSRTKITAGIIANYLVGRELGPVHLAVAGYFLRKGYDAENRPRPLVD